MKDFLKALFANEIVGFVFIICLASILIASTQAACRQLDKTGRTQQDTCIEAGKKTCTGWGDERKKCYKEIRARCLPSLPELSDGGVNALHN